MGAGQRRNEYEFENTSINDFAAMQFFLQIAVPFDLSSIIAPDGWNYLMWDPKLTPEITPSPPALTEAGELVDPNAGAWEPDFSGLLFYTLNDEFSVLPGETLGGFSFATDAIYSFREDAAFAGVSSRPVGLVDAGYEGSTTEYGFVGGPVMVAEPSTCLLIMGIVPLVRLRTRRRVRLTRRFAIARLSPAVAC